VRAHVCAPIADPLIVPDFRSRSGPGIHEVHHQAVIVIAVYDDEMSAAAVPVPQNDNGTMAVLTLIGPVFCAESLRIGAYLAFVGKGVVKSAFPAVRFEFSFETPRSV
jgi:hypothetical protein